MAYVNRPYYEADQVGREGPYGSYSSEYRNDEYGNRVPHQRPHHNGVGEVVSEVVTEVIPGGHHHGQYGRPAEVIERREERIVDSAYDPYARRNYY